MTDSQRPAQPATPALATAAPAAVRVFRGALFDMDGTLIDSTPSVDRAWGQWGVEWNMPDDFRSTFHGRPAREILAELVDPTRLEEAWQRIFELERDDTSDITVLAGAAALLDGLPEQRRAIVTSCTGDLARVRIAAAGLSAPATVVTIDDTERGKPNPDPFLEGARRLGFSASDCVAFEDAPAGLAAARAAGCTTVGIAGTLDAHLLDADYVVTSLEQVTLDVSTDGFRLLIDGKPV